MHDDADKKLSDVSHMTQSSIPPSKHFSTVDYSHVLLVSLENVEFLGRSASLTAQICWWGRFCGLCAPRLGRSPTNAPLARCVWSRIHARSRVWVHNAMVCGSEESRCSLQEPFRRKCRFSHHLTILASFRIHLTCFYFCETQLKNIMAALFHVMKGEGAFTCQKAPFWVNKLFHFIRAVLRNKLFQYARAIRGSESRVQGLKD